MESLSMALALGMASRQRGGIGDFELGTMGALLGEALDVIRCETSDVVVPADAEIVILSAWLRTRGCSMAGSSRVQSRFSGATKSPCDAAAARRRGS
jgi:hypothetical protein